jgi:hypothetical protein
MALKEETDAIFHSNIETADTEIMANDYSPSGLIASPGRGLR